MTRSIHLQRALSALSVIVAASPLLAARGCGEPGDPGACFCTEEYAPVCGSDGVTYGNACNAECAGATVASAGPCECPAPPIWCEWGYVVDERGCPTPECLEPPGCEPVACDVWCEHGHVVDERGCETCACNPPPDPTHCFADKDCGPGSFCDTSECLSPCDPMSGEACPAVCAGLCVAIPTPPARCASDDDCALGQICALPECAFFAEPGDDLPPECAGTCVTPEPPPCGDPGVPPSKQ